MKKLKSYQLAVNRGFFRLTSTIFTPAEPYRDKAPPNQAATLSSLQGARFGLLMEISACALLFLPSPSVTILTFAQPLVAC